MSWLLLTTLTTLTTKYLLLRSFDKNPLALRALRRLPLLVTLANGTKQRQWKINNQEKCKQNSKLDHVGCLARSA